MCQGLDHSIAKILQAQWCTKNPKTKLLGIRSSINEKLVWYIQGIPICVSIKGISLITMVYLSNVNILNISETFLNLLHNIAIKELMRQF